MAEIDLDFEPCEPGELDVDTQITQAIDRAREQQRVTWLTSGGVRVAAIVPADVGAAVDDGALEAALSWERGQAQRAAPVTPQPPESPPELLPGEHARAARAAWPS